MIEGLDSCHKFIFGICETYLTNKIADEDITIDGFSDKPFRVDCKSVTTRMHAPAGVSVSTLRKVCVLLIAQILY